MKLYLVPFFLLSAIAAKSQKADSLLTYSELSMHGRAYTKGVEIEGHTMRISEQIHHVYLDSANRYLYIETNNPDKENRLLLQYSLNDKRVRWSRDIVHEDDELRYWGKYVFLASGFRTILLNTETGNDTWRTTNHLIAVDTVKKLAFFYGEGYAKIKAVDMATGEEMWERKLGHYDSWRQLNKLTDSTLLITAGGLHVVNYFTGEGWDHDMLTSNPLYKGRVITYSAPPGYGAGTFTTMSHSRTGPMITELGSNVMINKGSLYVASVDELASFSYSGEKRWSHTLKSQLTSKSMLYDHGDNILLVNWGVARKKQDLIWYGQPFVAEYNKATGKQVFETLLDEYPILEFRIKDKTNTLYLLTRDNIALLSLATGDVMQNVKFPDGVKLNSLVERRRFVKEQDKYKPIFSTDTSALFIETNQGIYKLPKELTSAETIATATTYWLQAETGDKKLLNGSDKTLLIDGEKVMADLGNLHHPVMIGNTIFEVVDGTIIQYDIKYP